MQSIRNTFADYENGLCIFKETLQDCEETEKRAVFHGGASIVAISDHPRVLRYGLNCNVAADYLLFGSFVKAKSVEFWINLSSVSGTITIIDPVVGTDINQTNGTLSYGDWDNAFVDGVDTDTITTGWHRVVMTSSTDVTLLGGFNLGKGNIQVAGLRFWNYALSIAEVSQLYNGSVGVTKNDSVLILDLPNLTDLSDNGNNATNHGADIVASGRNSGNCLDFNGTSDYVDVTGMSDNTQTYTFSLWVKSSDVSNRTYLLDVELGRLVLAWVTTTPGQIGFYDGTWRDFGPVPAVGLWHYLTYVFDSSDSEAKLYIDGVQFGSTLAYTARSIGGTVVLSGTYDDSSANAFDGLIDQVKIYKRALTPMEVHQEWLRGQKGLL